MLRVMLCERAAALELQAQHGEECPDGIFGTIWVL